MKNLVMATAELDNIQRGQTASTLAEAFDGASPAESAEALPRVIESNLAVAGDHPATRRYLELLRDIRRARGERLFADTKKDFRQAQLEVAAAAGLSLKDRPGHALEISSEGDHWLNRWTKGLNRSKGVRLYWDPLVNHYKDSLASYHSIGRWIMSDNLGPLLLKPSSELFHEFLHAYVHRGKHAKKFTPLRTIFYNWGSYPKNENRPHSLYAQGSEFQADEILTNLHTTFDRARKIIAGYGSGKGGWTASSLEHAPPEIRQLVETLDAPIFLVESVREMSAQLLPGVVDVAQNGLAGNTLKKSYDPFGHRVPFIGEVEKNEKNDIGFYETELRDASPPIQISYFTAGLIREANPEAVIFPVAFARPGYAVRGELSLPVVEKLDLSDPEVQEGLIDAASRQTAVKLAYLQKLTESLEPSVERLKSLQARTRKRVNIKLIREIEEAGRAAFLQTAFFFINRPQPASL